MESRRTLTAPLAVSLTGAGRLSTNMLGKGRIVRGLGRSITPLALTVIAVAEITGARAWAQLPSPSELRQQFQETDRNGDGRIDREEFHRRSVDLFYFLEKDRKGYLM